MVLKLEIDQNHPEGLLKHMLLGCIPSVCDSGDQEVFFAPVLKVENLRLREDKPVMK